MVCYFTGSQECGFVEILADEIGNAFFALGEMVKMIRDQLAKVHCGVTIFTGHHFLSPFKILKRRIWKCGEHVPARGASCLLPVKFPGCPAYRRVRRTR